MVQFNRISSIVIILFSLLTAEAQSYFANGSARSLGASCYELTPNQNTRLGSVWYADKLDLKKDFDLEFFLNFGSSDAGADGIAFVMQTVGNRALGQSGGGLGFEGFSPSFGIEFDDYQNTSIGDPVDDHIAMMKNGSVQHSGSNSLALPASAIPGGGNIEDGQDHLVRIVWTANENRVEVYFDCIQRHNTIVDLVNDVFSGITEVFWGFTSATGGARNRQVACLKDDILIPDSIFICKGDKKKLNARESKNGSYTWTPIDFLDDPTIKTPECSSTIPMTYYVEYLDRCDNLIKDTISVAIDEPFVLDVGIDTLLCNNERLIVSLNSYDSIVWSDKSQSAKRALVDGQYRLTTWRGVCYDRDTFNLTRDTTPTANIFGDTLFCLGDSVLLNNFATAISSQYLWSDGTTYDSIWMKDGGEVKLSVINVCGADMDSIIVTQLFIDPFSIGADTILCIGDTIRLNAPKDQPYKYTWQPSMSSNSYFDVVEEGIYTLSLNLHSECSDRDSIIITSLTKPGISNLDDVLLCVNEVITISPQNTVGDIFWNENIKSESFRLKNFEGVVLVKAVNQCGEDSTSFNVNLVDCYCDLYFPSAFTPNNDNLNDVVGPTMNCNKLDFVEFEIYNRWGERLFESKSLQDVWDGIYKGSLAQNGIYLWVARWQGLTNGVPQFKTDKGTIFLIR